MSEGRRRRTREEDSDAESQASEENHHSDSESESDSSVRDEEEPVPNYEEAVKLETETEATIVVDKKEEVKPRSAANTPKRDPAVVPRSDRFFLHDNRESGSGKTGSGRSPRKGESARESERQDKRRTPKKEEVNLWKHDKYEEIVLKDTNKSSKPVSSQPRTNERSNKPSSVETSAPPRTKAAVHAAAVKDESPNTPDPVQAYIKNVKKVPAPNYSTNRTERPATLGPQNSVRSQDSRSSAVASRGPPSHPIESTTPVFNRQAREPSSAGKHASSPATRITYSQTAPTAPGSVEKQTQQQQGQYSNNSRGPSAGYVASSQRPSESSASHPAQQLAQPSYRSALETQAQRGGPVASGPTGSRTVPTTAPATSAPVFVPAVQQQVHVTLHGTPHAQQVAQAAGQRIEQTVRMTPIKAPPGLDTSLNPSAREFQPTDDSPTPTSTSSGRKEQRRYDAQGPSAYDYSPIVRPTGQNGPSHEAPHSAHPIAQQVSYRPVGGPSQPSSVPYTTQAHGHQQNPVHSPAHSDYRPRRDAPRGSETDLYSHNMSHMAHGAAHPSLMYRGAQGGYSVPMSMPVYDQMVYMDPRMQYMPDGTVWYANMPAPGPSEGAPVGGGTVYYPLPPTPGNE